MKISKPCPTCLQFGDFKPSNSVEKLYLNAAQTVTVNCPDGSSKEVSIPAGVVGFVLDFSIGSAPYPDISLNCVGGEIVVSVPDKSDQGDLDGLINGMLNKCVSQIATQSACTTGEFVNTVQQYLGCASDVQFVLIPGGIPNGVSISSDGHYLVIAGGIISSTISVSDANAKAIQLLKELFATGNAICGNDPPDLQPVLRVFNGSAELESGDTIIVST